MIPQQRSEDEAIMRIFALALVLAATQTASPAGCSPTKVCDVYYHGVYVQAGQVRDVVTPICDRPPAEHEIEAWMEYRRIGEYSPLARRHAYSWIIPDKTGFPLEVSSGTCVEGWYRAGEIRQRGGLRGRWMTVKAQWRARRLRFQPRRYADIASNRWLALRDQIGQRQRRDAGGASSVVKPLRPESEDTFVGWRARWLGNRAIDLPAGAEGTVTEVILAPGNDRRCYRITFDNDGPVIHTYLPAPWDVELIPASR